MNMSFDDIALSSKADSHRGSPLYQAAAKAVFFRISDEKDTSEMC